jgi:hypothetical protein
MINDPHNRRLLYRSIDAMQVFADSYKQSTRTIAANGILTRSTDWPERLLRVDRIACRAERILDELHALLDQPPGMGSSEPPRLVPRPIRPVDGIAQPGLAVPGPGDGGPAAA